MKIVSVILAMVILLSALQSPQPGITFVPAEPDTEACATVCCAATQDTGDCSGNEEQSGNSCNAALCNPFAACYCCCVLPVAVLQLHLRTAFPSAQQYDMAGSQDMPEGYYGDTFQPPEIDNEYTNSIS